MRNDFPYSDRDIANILVRGLQGKQFFGIDCIEGAFGHEVGGELKQRAIHVLLMMERDGAIRCVCDPWKTDGPIYQFCVPVVVDFH